MNSTFYEFTTIHSGEKTVMLKIKYLSIFILILIVVCHAAASDTPKRVLIIPFHIHSSEDLGFLENGIQAMLSTRLALENDVIPIGKEEAAQALQTVTKPINEKTAFALGKKLGADYVVFGSLTVFGKGISTDARFLDIQKETAVVTFSQFGKSRDEVLSHIDMFAGLVNEKVFGRKTYTRAYQPVPEKEPEAGRRKHPESIFYKQDQGVSETPLWKSRRFKTGLSGIAVGDVDADKKNEVIFVGKRKLYIYRYAEGTLSKIADIDGDVFHEYIGVDVADINNNGTAEIFVTSYNRDQQAISSFVLEWNGAKFVTIVKGQRWFYRVVDMPGRGKTLLGQKDRGDDVFQKDVHELTWRGGGYASANVKKYRKPLHVFGLAFGNVLKDGREMVVSFAEDDRIRISDDASGSEIWKSDEKYGGNSIYLEFYDKDAGDIGEHKEMKHVYLPLRIHFVDINKDGKKEVLVPKNKDSAGRYLARLRLYKNGHLEGLEWNDAGLTPKWKTRKMPGYISDWVIADIDNDQQDEIVCAVVQRTSPLSGSEKSYIVILELGS